MKSNRFNFLDGRGLIFWLSLFVLVLSFAFPVAKTSSEVIKQFGMGYDPCRIFSEEIESGIAMAISAGLMILFSFINCLTTPTNTIPKTWLRYAYAVSGIAYFISTMAMFNSQYSPYTTTFSIHLCRIMTVISVTIMLCFKSFLEGANSAKNQ